MPEVRPRHRSSRRSATALVERLGLKPRLAFGPVRAAITGRRISPPLFESMELLGRESTLARIAAAPRWSLKLGSAEWPQARSRTTAATPSQSRPDRIGHSVRSAAGLGTAATEPQAAGSTGPASPPSRERRAAARTARPTRRSCAARAIVWWRSLLGVVFGLSLFLLLTAVVSQALVIAVLGD